MQNLRYREVACSRDNSFSIRLALLLTVAVSGQLFYHFSTGLSRAQDPTPAATAAETDHYLCAAVYSMREGQKSSLVLNNALNRPMSARVALYNKHGQALVVPEIDLSSNGNRYFNVADWLSTAEIEDFSEGSLELFFHGASMGIGAQLVVEDQDHGLSFDVFLTEDMDFDSSRLDSLWWSLDDKTRAQVFLANTKLSRLIVTPTFYVRGVGIESEPIILNSHESETLDIQQALNKLKVRQSTTTGGISLRHNGPPGSLAAVGVVANKQRGFSSTLRFADPLMQTSTILHGAHLLIGHPPPQSGMPHGASFVPRIMVRNTTDSPVDLKGRVRYRADNSSATVEIDPVTFRSNEVRDLDLSPVIASVGANTITDAGIEIEHSGQPGSIVASAASIDATGNLVLDVPVKDPRAKMTMAGGNYPWRIDGENRAVVHLKNIDPITQTRARTAVVVIYYDGGSYSLPLQSVEAGQTFEVDINRLRDQQIKDSFGKVIPMNVSRGQLVWYGRGPLGQFTGRLVQYNAKAGTSSSFSCPLPCDCEPTYTSGRIDPSSIQGMPGDVYFITLIEVDRDCNGSLYEFQVNDPSAFVSSSSPFVASVAGPTSDPFGNAVWQVALGNQAGTATLNASWDAVHNFATCIGPSFGGHCSEFRCDSSFTTGSASANVTVFRLRIRVAGSLITFDNSDSGASIVAGENFAIIAEAINAAGNVMPINIAVSTTASRTLASGEIGLPTNFNIVNGSYTAQGIVLNRVNGTDSGTSYRFSTAAGGLKDFSLYTYFRVTATREGIVGGRTSCGHTIQPNDHFVSLPSTGLCNTGIVVRNGTLSATTTIQEVGPWFPHSSPSSGNPCVGPDDPYWNTGGVPRVLSESCDANNAAIDLADGTASDVGITGLGSVVWRFQ